MKRMLPVIGMMVLGLTMCARAAVEVSAFRLEESRQIALAPDRVGHSGEGLKVVLALKGPEADAAVKYGELKIDEAVDDKGNALAVAKDSFHDPAKFREYSNAFFREHHSDKPDAPQVEVSLGASKRAATKISRLRGSLTLSEQGILKTIELPKLKSAGKTKLDIPAAAGVGISINVKTDNGNSTVEFETTGDENALESIEVFDAAGNKISNGVSTWSFGGGPVHKSLGLEKPADDTMKLVAKVSLGRKLTKVQFDLKDIPLP